MNKKAKNAKTKFMNNAKKQFFYLQVGQLHHENVKLILRHFNIQ